MPAKCDPGSTKSLRIRPNAALIRPASARGRPNLRPVRREFGPLSASRANFCGRRPPFVPQFWARGRPDFRHLRTRPGSGQPSRRHPLQQQFDWGSGFLWMVLVETCRLGPAFGEHTHHSESWARGEPIRARLDKWSPLGQFWARFHQSLARLGRIPGPGATKLGPGSTLGRIRPKLAQVGNHSMRKSTSAKTPYQLAVVPDVSADGGSSRQADEGGFCVRNVFLRSMGPFLARIRGVARQSMLHQFIKAGRLLPNSDQTRSTSPNFGRVGAESVQTGPGSFEATQLGHRAFQVRRLRGPK